MPMNSSNTKWVVWVFFFFFCTFALLFSVIILDREILIWVGKEVGNTWEQLGKGDFKSWEVVVPALNPGAQQRQGVQGQPGLHCALQDSQGYVMYCLTVKSVFFFLFSFWSRSLMALLAMPMNFNPGNFFFSFQIYFSLHEIYILFIFLNSFYIFISLISFLSVPAFPCKSLNILPIFMVLFKFCHFCVIPRPH